MKYLLSLVGFTFCVLTIHSQISESNNLLTNLKDNGSYESERTNAVNSRVAGVVWEETFSNGIPDSWSNLNLDSDGNMTDATWEYRGPDTTPNNLLGTVGNCIEPGTLGGDPIMSLTSSDGFVIFDSDYWDSNEGECTDFGTGIAPAPHNASLITESINLTDINYVALEFSQFLKNFSSLMKVQISVDGSDFEDIYTNDFTGANESSPKDMVVRINVTEQAAGQSDVKFSFNFQGSYYYWMIDDVRVIELQQNDLVLENVLHSSLNLENTEDFVDFLGIQYFKYPVTSTASFTPSARAMNEGGEPQTNATLNISLVSQGGEFYNETTEPAMVDVSSSVTLGTPTTSIPEETGEYSLTYSLNQSEEDQVPENNSVMKTIEITSGTLARDEGKTDSFYLPAEENMNSPYEVGAIYVPTEAGNELHSISAAVGSSTLTNTNCYATLYGFTLINGLQLEPIATTDFEFVQSWHLNNFGDEKMMVFEFPEPIELVQDSSYLAVVGTMDNANNVIFSMAGEAQPLTAWAKFDDGDGVPAINYLSRIPMVRMNFEEVSNIQDLEVSQGFEANIFPNPADEEINLNYTLSQRSELIVGLFDVQGRHLENLYVGEDSAGTHNLRINVASLAKGMYFIRMNSEVGKLEKPLIIE